MQLTLVSGEDWCGLYVDGHLEFEGHSLPWFELVQIIDRLKPELNLEIIEPLGAVSSIYLENTGYLPNALKDVIYE